MTPLPIPSTTAIFNRKKMWLLALLLAIVGFLAWGMETIKIRGPLHDAPRGVKDRIYIHQGQLIGQSFRPPWNISGVGIVLDGTKNLSGKVILRLRQTPQGPDLRTVTKTAKELELGETVNFFSFPVLRLSRQKQLYWILEAPQIEEGQLWTFREIDSSIYPDGSFLRNNTTQPGDLTFQLEGEVRRLRKVIYAPTFPRRLRPSPQTWKLLATILIIISGTAAAVLKAPSLLYQMRRPVFILGLLLFALHLPFALRWPAINDEGSYLLDAAQMSWQHLPFRDYLTKGPVLILALKIWQIFTPSSLFAARLFSALVSAASLLPLYLLSLRVSSSRRTALGCAVLFTFTAGVSAFSSHVLTQPLALFWGLWGLNLLTSPRLTPRQRGSYSAVCLTLALLTRISTAVFLPLALLIIYWQENRRKALCRSFLTTFFLSGLVAAAAFFLLAGWPRALIALNLESFLVAQQHHRDGGMWFTYPPREIHERIVALFPPFWRSSALLISLALLAPFLLLRYWHTIPLPAAALPVWLAWFFLWQHLPPAWRALQAVDPSEQLAGRLLFIASTGLVLLPLILKRPSRAAQSAAKHHLRLLALGTCWLALLIVLYTIWGRWRSNYLYEFFPALALLGGYTLSQLWSILQRAPSSPAWKRILPALWCGTLAATMYFSFQRTIPHPHTGTIELAAAREMQQLIKKTIPPQTPLFTAQALFPVLTNRPISPPLASHPGWILSDRHGEVPAKLRRLYFPSDDELLNELKQAQFVLVDRRTRQIYFALPALQKTLQQNFMLIGEVKNPSHPLQLYRRRPENTAAP